MSQVKLLKPEEAGLTDKIQIFEDAIRTDAKRGSYLTYEEKNHVRGFYKKTAILYQNYSLFFGAGDRT